jgi:secondary thiamine-phosphate synthase enzyme
MERNMKSFPVNTQHHSQFVRIDHEVQRIVTDSGIDDGVCYVFVPHTTAGITINENADPDVVRDIIQTLERLVPWKGAYAHVEGNSAAHLKASMMGSSQAVIVEHGKLALGTWQSIYFCEFDGPRSRQVWVEVLPCQG